MSEPHRRDVRQRELCVCVVRALTRSSVLPVLGRENCVRSQISVAAACVLTESSPRTRRVSKSWSLDSDADAPEGNLSAARARVRARALSLAVHTCAGDVALALTTRSGFSTLNFSSRSGF